MIERAVGVLFGAGLAMVSLSIVGLVALMMVRLTEPALAIDGITDPIEGEGK